MAQSTKLSAEQLSNLVSKIGDAEVVHSGRYLTVGNHLLRVVSAKARISTNKKRGTEGHLMTIVELKVLKTNNREDSGGPCSKPGEIRTWVLNHNKSDKSAGNFKEFALAVAGSRQKESEADKEQVNELIRSILGDEQVATGAIVVADGYEIPVGEPDPKTGEQAMYTIFRWSAVEEDSLLKAQDHETQTMNAAKPVPAELDEEDLPQ